MMRILQITALLFCCCLSFFAPSLGAPSSQPIELGLWQNGLPLQSDQRQYIDKTEIISAFRPPPIPPVRPDETNGAKVNSTKQADEDIQFVISRLNATNFAGYNNQSNNKTQLEYHLLKKLVKSNQS